MAGSIRDDLQRRAEEVAQRQSNAEHDIRVLEAMLDRTAAARDRLDDEAQELVKVAQALGMTFKKPSLYSYPINELTGEDWK
ncbi:hypothetical protein [Brevundimonas sp.]|uniref:hypothetical protein n=1 Tax=Brevundimonas sp. TaxID=1871086 RepID=UPI0028972A89|nr:hypothetical protein [Brevundimonas sp.]